MLETVKDYYYPGEPEEFECYGKEDEEEDYGDEDEEGEGEEGEEGGDDYGEEDYGEEEVWPPPEYTEPMKKDDRFFGADDKIRG